MEHDHFIWKISSGSLISQEIGNRGSVAPSKQIEFSVTDLIQTCFLKISRKQYIYIVYAAYKLVYERKLQIRERKDFHPTSLFPGF